MPRDHFEVRNAVRREGPAIESRVEWDEESPIAGQYETRKGVIEVRHGYFVGGSSDRVEVVTVDTGAARTWILPTRGMGIWKIESGGVDFGWDSPITGPIHPSRVPTDRADGLGWLEGFDELVVRCGLESNGAPQFNDHEQLVYPLHGRVANQPAESLSLDVDTAAGTVELCGVVVESMLFFKRLRLVSRIRMSAGSADVDVLDDVTNDLSSTTQMQLLYHINVGAPVLSEASKVLISADQVAPKDSLSAETLSEWNQGQAPTEGQAERVYFSRARAGEDGRATAMIVNAESSHALALTFGTRELPYFIVWKNTAAESDGYVTGLEPATGLPNTREFEGSQGRLVELESGETRSFRITISLLNDSEAIKQFEDRIATINGDDAPEVLTSPKPGWSPGA